jgi:hypothetical protein
MSEPQPEPVTIDIDKLARLMADGFAFEAGGIDRDLEDAAGKAIGAIGRLVIDYVREPENQAYMVGCMLTAPLTHKMRAIPGILVTMCGGYAARQAYRATRDLRDLAEAATAERNADAPDKG